MAPPRHHSTQLHLPPAVPPLSKRARARFSSSVSSSHYPAQPLPVAKTRRGIPSCPSTNVRLCEQVEACRPVYDAAQTDTTDPMRGLYLPQRPRASPDPAVVSGPAHHRRGRGSSFSTIPKTDRRHARFASTDRHRGWTRRAHPHSTPSGAKPSQATSGAVRTALLGIGWSTQMLLCRVRHEAPRSCGRCSKPCRPSRENACKRW